MLDEETENQVNALAFDREVDVLVIGGGVAGLAAAITASELDADVVLIEKLDRLGGSASWSAGNLLELNGPEALDHLVALSFGRTPVEVLAAYREGLSGLRTWLTEHGAHVTDVDPRLLPNCWPNSPGADGVVYYAVDGGTHGAGAALVDALTAVVTHRGIPVSLRTSLVELITDESRVVGAQVKDAAGSTQRIAARRGVVLATGGFENSPELTAAYLPIEPVFPVGSPGSTGDGLRAAAQVGAALWHMSVFYGFWALRRPEASGAYPLLLLHPGHLIVDPDGRRFHAETGREAHDALRSLGDFLPARPNRPGLPAYAIFDRALLGFGPLCRFSAPGREPWSADNSTEVERGWIHAASNVDELAGAIGVDAERLAETVAAYNDAARAGLDPEFGRPAASMSPVDPSQLFAVELWPGVATTSGGPQRDAAARVISSDGSPIPGLFAAGGTGGVWGHLTEHGGGLTDGLVFGAIAARTAVSR